MQLSHKPDIILLFLSDQYFDKFFQCILYLEDAKIQNKRDIVQQFLLKKTNQIFEIDNKDILESLKINYWILFLKDVLFPEVFKLDQQNYLQEYLMLHANNIILFLADNMDEIFGDIEQKIVQDSTAVSFFFQELFQIFRDFSFVSFKSEFTKNFFGKNYHVIIIELLRSTLRDIHQY